MKIATFGSCLSRYTANSFVKLFGGKIISSVYHNRSDAFVAKFIEKKWEIDDFDDISSQLINNFREEIDVDNVPVNILKNQYPEWIGKHRLSSGIPFLDALVSGEIDLIFVDNYMDLAAKLAFNSRGHGYFLRLGDFSSSTSNWSVGEYLSPVDGVSAMSKIIDFFKIKSPNSKIIFTNFPYNTYSDSPFRVERTKEYEKLFDYSGIKIIPCLNIHKNFQTKQRQHFSVHQYCAYAGVAKGFLNI